MLRFGPEERRTIVNEAYAASGRKDVTAIAQKYGVGRTTIYSCLREKVPKHSLFIHSDNGGPMKAATMLNTLRRLGVVPSFSRPNVSDDNAFSEALFKTLKYRLWYPEKPFSSYRTLTCGLKTLLNGTTQSTFIAELTLLPQKIGIKDEI